MPVPVDQAIVPHRLHFPVVPWFSVVYVLWRRLLERPPSVSPFH